MTKSAPLPNRRVRVAMIVSGFPTADAPNRGVFNVRAAHALAEVADITVLFLRAWVPGRRCRTVSRVGDVKVTTVVAPQVPVGRLFGRRVDTAVNAILYRIVGWYLLASSIRACDIIHSVDTSGTGIVASAWARWAGKHHVAQVTGSDVNWILPGVRSLYGISGWENDIHAVACNSAALRAAFLRMYPHAPNVQVVYRGVDLQLFNPVGPIGGPVATGLPVRFLFLGGFAQKPMVSSLANTKGGETLLAAWQAAEHELAESGASLVLGGPNAESVRDWRAGLKFPDRVFVVGRVHPAEIPSYIRGADVVLVPSLKDGLPNISMEASACARPVFGSRVGGIPEVVVEGETGILLGAGEVAAWRDALVRYSRQPNQLREMGLRARASMEERFASKNYAPQMYELYQAALRLPTRPTGVIEPAQPLE
jgi:glycosyltransferase involved in cell wall biosynthesis